jgi:hypothetical protein
MRNLIAKIAIGLTIIGLTIIGLTIIYLLMYGSGKL